jgi:tetratricopeptide (TPR) repeat protein
MAVVRNVLAICEKVLGPEHPLTAESLYNLAATLQAQGDYAAARPLYERALAIREKVLGPALMEICLYSRGVGGALGVRVAISHPLPLVCPDLSTIRHPPGLLDVANK